MLVKLVEVEAAAGELRAQPLTHRNLPLKPEALRAPQPRKDAGEVDVGHTFRGVRRGKASSNFSTRSGSFQYSRIAASSASGSRESRSRAHRVRTWRKYCPFEVRKRKMFRPSRSQWRQSHQPS